MGSEQKISCLYFCTDWGNVCGPPFDRRTVTGTRKPPSMRSDVIVEVKCLWESDTEVLGFSQFHAGSTSLCYDILYWFSVNWLSRPLSFNTAHYHGNDVFTSMSNKVTMKLISARYKHFCFGFTAFGHTYMQQNYPAELILFQQALFPQLASGDFREFSLPTILQISCGLIVQALKLD